MVSRAKRSGFSLLELLFALVIISTVLAIAIPRIDNGLELHLKASARKLASSVRFTFNESVARNRYYRLVFSMPPGGEHSFWVEVADKPVLIRTPEQEEAFQRKLQYLNEEQRKRVLDRESKFVRLEGSLSKTFKLNRGLQFKDIYVSHQPGRIDQGEAYLYFFPNGSTEQAVINLVDTEGDVYSLEIFPLSGKVVTRREYLDYQNL